MRGLLTGLMACTMFFLTLAGLPLQAQSIAFGSQNPLNSTATTDTEIDGFPSVATDGLQNWVVVWDSWENLNGTAGTDRDIFFARSTNDGATWTPAATLNLDANTDFSADLTPVIDVGSEGTWITAWVGDEILASRSMNNGITWSEPAEISRDEQTNVFGDQGLDLATDDMGTWIAVWHASEHFPLGERDVFYTRSTDNGVTWSKIDTANSDAAQDSGNESFPVVRAGGEGVWIVAWRSLDLVTESHGTDEDIFFARSLDNGVTWSPLEPLNHDALTDNKDDSDVALETNRNGNWVAAWMSRRSTGSGIEIEYARSTDNGSTWTPAKPLDPGANSMLDSNPYLTTDGLGNWITLWARPLPIDPPSDFEIVMSHSTDAGQTWGPSRILNSRAEVDMSDNGSPVLATGADCWIAVWTSTDKVDGVYGTDSDIFYAVGKSLIDFNVWVIE